MPTTPSDFLVGEKMNRSRRAFDALLALKASGAAVTTSTNETGVAFKARPNLEYVCEVAVSACPTGTNETYVFNVGVCDTQGGTYVTIGSLTWTRGTTGLNIIPLTGPQADYLIANTPLFIRIGVTITGAAPSITYQAALAPSTS